MKIRNLLLSGVLGALATTAATATPVDIYVAGAPAGRAYFSKAIYDALGGAAAGITYSYSSSSVATVSPANAFTYSNALIFYGGSVSGTAVTVHVTYPGSSASIQEVAYNNGAGLTAPFLPPADSGTTGSGYPDPTSSGNPTDAEIPSFAAADEFQASTPWLGTTNYASTYNSGNAVTYATLDGDDIAGVLPIRFVASPDAPSDLTNITPQQAQVLFKTGYIWLSQLTGNPSESGTAVYAIGRDIGSGLKTVLLAETGIGGPETAVNQFEPTVTGSGTAGHPWVATAQTQYVAETVNGVPLAAGAGGYPSFAKILPAISAYTITNGGSLVGPHSVNYPARYNNTNATGAIYITAVDDADAITVETNATNPVKELSYNGFYVAGAAGGVLPTSGTGTSEIDNGQYTLWSYLQLEYQSALANSSGNGHTTGNPLAYAFEQLFYAQLLDNDSPILLNSVNVSRTQDGGNIGRGQVYPTTQ